MTPGASRRWVLFIGEVMQFKAIKTFYSDQLGKVEKDTEFEATQAQVSGVRLFVQEYEAKVVFNKPTLPVTKPTKGAK